MVQAWSSPIVLAKKQDWSLRFCVDFRHVNDVTKKNVHPIPRIDETLDTLGRAHWFTTLDLASGYWQVELEQEDREKTAFSTPLDSTNSRLSHLASPITLHISKVNGIGFKGFALVHMSGVLG